MNMRFQGKGIHDGGISSCYHESLFVESGFYMSFFREGTENPFAD